MTNPTNDFHVTINGLDVHARYSKRAVREIFLPFLQAMTDLHRSKKKRVLIMLAAPPGAGKSTLLAYLEKLSAGTPGIEKIQTIGIDGFHRYQDYLLTHTTERGGERIPMVKIKGAPITFDLEKLTERVKKVAAGEVCGWPMYDRLLHNPVEDAITVDGGIVLLEGNYLLLDEEGWRDLRQYADYTIMIRAEEAMLRERLVRRRMQTGVPEKEAGEFVDYSDMVNVRTCLMRSAAADLVLRIDEEGEYYRVGGDASI